MSDDGRCRACGGFRLDDGKRCPYCGALPDSDVTAWEEEPYERDRGLDSIDPPTEER